MPDPALLLDEANRLLTANGFPVCHSVTPMADGDTANPNLIGHASDRRYVIKVTERHPDSLEQQLEVANALRDTTNLPIPRHYCCAQAGDRFPLMVMEWLPGEQLRTVLAVAEGRDLERLCAGLGACLAVFHDPEHLRLVPEADASASQWLHARTLAALEATVADSPRGGGELDIAAVRRYIDARLAATTVRAIPSLVKADQDLRDFLADPVTFETTGMLDWERVTAGDGVFAVTLVFFRLWLNRKLDGWPHFLGAYNLLARVPAAPCPQAEFYLMCRAVLAHSVNDRARELVHLLLGGDGLPFGSGRGIGAAT